MEELLLYTRASSLLPRTGEGSMRKRPDALQGVGDQGMALLLQLGMSCDASILRLVCPVTTFRFALGRRLLYVVSNCLIHVRSDMCDRTPAIYFAHSGVRDIITLRSGSLRGGRFSRS